MDDEVLSTEMNRWGARVEKKRRFGFGFGERGEVGDDE